MDELSIGSLCLGALATLVLALALKGALGAKGTGPELPPGPWNLPVIGSIHHLVGAPPHRALLRLARRHGPLMLVRFGEVSTVVVSSSKAAMEVLKARDPVFAGRPSGATLDIVSFGGRGIVMAPYGEHWRQVRKVCVMELLSAKQVQLLESIRQEEVSRLVESITTTAVAMSPATASVVNLTEALAALTNDIVARAAFGGRCRQQEEYLRALNVVTTLAALTNDIVARAAFGGRCRQQEEYLRALNVVTTLAAGFSLVDLFPSSRLVRWLSSAERRLRKSHAQMVRVVNSIVQERKDMAASGGAGAKDDGNLLDVLLRLQKEDTLSFPLTGEIVCALLSDIIGAATDTTASTLEWTVAELIRNPEAMERAKTEVRNTLGHGRTTLTGADLGELHYLQMVIKEALRLHPPIALIIRASQESCSVMGYDMPRGTPVSVNAFAVGTDPDRWDEAEKFRPERFDGDGMDSKATVAQLGFVPFGAGRRQCPGALFATTTMELVLANLLYHYDWTLPNGESPESIDMGEVYGLTVHRRSNLRLQAALSRSSGFREPIGSKQV